MALYVEIVSIRLYGVNMKVCLIVTILIMLGGCVSLTDRDDDLLPPLMDNNEFIYNKER
jgi:hypothetical protein